MTYRVVPSQRYCDLVRHRMRPTRRQTLRTFHAPTGTEQIVEINEIRPTEIILCCILTHLTLLSVHDRKRVAAWLLVALFCQFNQFGELVMDHDHHFRILLCPATNKFRILWLQFRWHIGITNLQTDRKSSIAFLHPTFLCTLECLVIGHFDGTENVAQFDHSAILHLFNTRCQFRRGNFAIIRREILTRAHLLAQTTLTQYFDHLTAWSVRAWRIQMTRCVAAVRTHHAWFLRAILFAHFRFALAVRMTGFLAFVLATFERFVARQTAAEFALTARNNFSLLVFAVTILRGKGHARWTVLRRMAVAGEKQNPWVWISEMKNKL